MEEDIPKKSEVSLSAEKEELSSIANQLIDGGNFLSEKSLEELREKQTDLDDIRKVINYLIRLLRKSNHQDLILKLYGFLTTIEDIQAKLGVEDETFSKDYRLEIKIIADEMIDAGNELSDPNFLDFT
ncbi:MAG: hypothetical protein H6566_29655 [Lewinellaceae bacterium]|nr:hypothetical protein [Lewinellaceae bacterium]